MSEILSEESKRVMDNIEKTGSRPYSETKKILDEATARTVKNLSPKRRRIGFFSK